jgi:lambda repressor-like predicted transcriptional regulator
MANQSLQLLTAIQKLNTSKQDLSKRTKYSPLELQMMNDNGINLSEAEVIANAYGVHPSEIWGDAWVDAVLNADYIDGLYKDSFNE